MYEGHLINDMIVSGYNAFKWHGNGPNQQNVSEYEITHTLFSCETQCFHSGEDSYCSLLDYDTV